MNNSIIHNIQRLLAVSLIVLGMLSVGVLSYVEYKKSFSERNSITDAYLSILKRSIVKPISEGNYILTESYFNLRSVPFYFQSIKYYEPGAKKALIDKKKMSSCSLMKNKAVYLEISKPFDNNKLQLGHLVVSISYCDLRESVINKLILFLLVSIILISLLHVSISKAIKKILEPLHFNQDEILNLHDVECLIDSAPIELKSILYSLEDVLLEANKLKVDQQNLLVSKQLAHDIRSPLTALDMSIKTINFLDSDQKYLVRSAINRIHDIANNLIGKTKVSSLASSEIKVTLLNSIVSSIISEKRTEFRDLHYVEIDFLISKQNFGLFSSINVGELKRIISNLVNNSVEAIGENEGFIEISVEKYGDENRVLIHDNGKGIPSDSLQKIFENGFSLDKEDGTGIGLFHAYGKIKEWGGSLNVNSSVGQGTCFTISLPSSSPPQNFVSSISILSSNTIVIVDDDTSIHKVWRGLLATLDYNLSHIVEFTDPVKFIEWYSKEGNSNITYFIDYEFLGHKLNGLDLLESIKGDKYLVTSRYEEDVIMKQCDIRNIKIIDKGMITFVPINICKDLIKILIDNDELIHMSWKMEADKADVELDCYFTIAEFLAVSDKYDRATTVYVDSNLADDIKGEVESEKIYKAGFKNIYLATGYSPEDFEKPEWIKEIVGKRAKFK